MALIVLVPGGQVQAQANAPLVVRLQAPAQVQVGEAIQLVLQVSEGSGSIGGMEASILYDPAAAEFAAFNPPAATAQTGLGRLIVPDGPAGSSVGYFTCATPECHEVGSALAAMASAGAASVANDRIGTVEILPLEAGQLEIHLDNLQIVDQTGQPLPVQIGQSSVTVQVGEGGVSHPAPVTPWQMPAAQTAAESSIASVDLTSDGKVDNADVMETALSWEIVHEQDAACDGSEAAADLNHDGCVTVADVQLATTKVGTTAPTSEPPQVDPSQFPNQLYLPSLQSDGTAASDSNDATAQSVAALTFVVNTVADDVDAKIGDGICRTAKGACTLRAAIAEANSHSGSDNITFAIAGSGVHTIQLTGRLPSLSDSSGGTTIDGYSQAGAARNTSPTVSNAKLMIEIRGQDVAFDALAITTSNNVVKGLSFYNLRRSLWIYGSAATQNIVVGNFIGTNAASTYSPASVSTSSAHGIMIEQGSQHNRIGGTSPAERNIISGNRRSGIGMWHWPTSYNIVYNNIIGLSADGTQRLGNRLHGIDMNFGASNNIIGGTATGQHNVVSGNSAQGIEISHDSSTQSNQIIGNFVGTYASGNVAGGFTRNSGYGIQVKDRVRNNTIANNVVANNTRGGLIIDNFGTCCLQGNVFQNNRIGIGINGAALGNFGNGITVLGPNSRIGPGNIIANNSADGILVGGGNDDDNNTITQNSIFANVSLGIDIAPTNTVNLNDSGDADSGPNQQLNFPVLSGARVDHVAGTACASCTVEIFISTGQSGKYGQGKTFVGSGKASTSGSFVVNVTGVALGNFVTATATDAAGNTSEFSANIQVK